MGFELGPLAPYAAIALLLGLFILFLMEIRPPDIVAFCGAAVALALGLITTDDVLAAFANPAPATIGAMFILSAALVRTGALEAVIDVLRDMAGKRPVFAIVLLLAGAAAASAFMNNTPVVMVLIPIVITLAREIRFPASKMLIPLSYMVILGGTCTLIGTSTNLLVDGVTRDLGYEPFTIFEIAPLGICVAMIGGAFLGLVGVRLLPIRMSTSLHLGDRQPKNWLANLQVEQDSPLIGQPVLEIPAFTRGGGRVVDVIRGDQSLRRKLREVTIEPLDTVVVKTRDAELMTLRENNAEGAAIAGLQAAGSRSSVVVEVLVGPSARVIGRTLGEMRWRRRYGVYPMALHREGTALTASLEETRLEIGDTLLIDGAPEDIGRLAEDAGLANLSQSGARAVRRGKAPIAIAVLVGVVLLSALDIAPILPLSLIGVAIVLLTRCLDADDGVGALDGRLLLLVVSMLAIGSALDRSGALDMIVGWLGPLLGNASPLMALAIIYAATSCMTELVTNNAVAVLMTPIAAGVATHLGLDPRPFIVAVMFGASASFATPIGYQTNTLVYNAGGYRFADFLRVGLPMNILIGIVTVLLTPLFWPLHG